MQRKNKEKNKNQKNSKIGFTLLELLVVVLIIGILAAISLPQYQLAAGKAKLSTLKSITRNTSDSVRRYYLEHGVIPHKTSDLDIGFKITYENYSDTFSFTTDNNTRCVIWKTSTVACNKKISGKTTAIYINSKGLMYSCLVYSTNKTDIPNRVCRNDTGHESDFCGDTGYCTYPY